MYSELLWAFTKLPPSYIAIDTETTSLFHGDIPPDMITLGLCFVEEGEIVSKKEFKFKPERPFEDNSMAVHGITWEEAETFPMITESWDNINELMTGNLILAHNAAFDWRVLDHAAKALQLKMPLVKGVFCTQRGTHSWATATGIPCSERGPSLQTLIEHLRIRDKRSVGKHPHSAKQDAFLLAKVTQALTEKSIKVLT